MAEGIDHETPSVDPAWPTLDDRWITLDATFESVEGVATLTGAPSGFNEYAADLVGPDGGCTMQIRVQAMHPEGYVVGGDGYADCGGGAQVIWSNQGGQWDVLFATQDGYDCYELAEVGIPENSGAIECWADGQYWWY